MDEINSPIHQNILLFLEWISIIRIQLTPTRLALLLQ